MGKGCRKFFNNGVFSGFHVVSCFIFLFIVLLHIFTSALHLIPNKSQKTYKTWRIYSGNPSGSQTVEYISKISNRLNLFAELSCCHCCCTYIDQNSFSGSTAGNVSTVISGAGMIIIVGVVLELVRQINAQLVMHDYDKLV